MNKIDLHMHSIASLDGEFTTQQLIDIAYFQQLNIIAIADHNSTKAYHQVYNAKDIKLIPAIELDCVLEGVDYHLLGYFIHPFDEVYDKIEEDILNQERQASHKRLSMLKKHLHLHIALDELDALSRDGIYVPETICEVAMKDERNKDNPYLQPYFKGGNRSDNPYVNFYWDYCSQGKIAYTKINFMSMQDAIAIIHKQGGFAVLAHPGNNVKEKSERIAALKQVDLDGIEVYSSYHNKEQVAFYQQFALANNLLQTCGSDFHGKTKPNVKMGQCQMPKSEEEKLIRYLEERS